MSEFLRRLKESIALRCSRSLVDDFRNMEIDIANLEAETAAFEKRRWAMELKYMSDKAKIKSYREIVRECIGRVSLEDLKLFLDDLRQKRGH